MKKKYFFTYFLLFSLLLAYRANATEVGADTKIGTNLNSAQYPQLVYCTNQNNFLLVWNGDEDGKDRIYYNFQDEAGVSGTPVASGTLLSAVVPGKFRYAERPQVAYDASSNTAAVVWQESHIVMKDSVVMAIINTTTKLKTAQIVVASNTWNMSATVSSDQNGTYLVSWYDATTKNIYGRFYDTSGSSVGSDVTLGSVASGYLLPYSIDMDYDSSDGQFLVSWVDLSTNLFSRTVKSDGTLGIVNNYSSISGVINPAIAYNDLTNKFLLVYDDFAGNIAGILTDNTGVKVGGPLTFGSTPGIQAEPDVRLNGDNHAFAVSWHDPTVNAGIWFQEYSPDLVPTFTTAIKIDSKTATSYAPSIAYGGNHLYWVTWFGQSPAMKDEIYLQRYETDYVPVIPVGTEELSYRFANPRITNITGTDYFEFDVQVKADVAGTYFWKGLVNLTFNNSTLSTNIADWVVTKGSSFSGANSLTNPKYDIEMAIDGTSPNAIFNLSYSADANTRYKTATSADFVEATTDYQTLASVRGKIEVNTDVAGVDFNEINMNGQQFYKLSAYPWYSGYKNLNGYDVADFVDTYVGRIYSDNSSLSLKSAKIESLWPGWTQASSLDWSANVNTSVWNGNAVIPGGSIANASNMRIHNQATLSIPVDGEMTVLGETDIKTDGEMRIESDANGTGSFITNTTAGAGLAIAQRYMTTGAWHIVSSPVSGQSIADFLTTNSNVATKNGDLRGMMNYVPDLNAWGDYFTNSTLGNLDTGIGFSIRTNTNSAVAFKGKLQTGIQATTGLSQGNWNCVGNPYTSAIGINNLSSSVNNFLDVNVGNLDPIYAAVYVWDNPDANNGLPGKYTIISNTPTPLTAFDVQQGQAYMVKMNSVATSLDFNSAMQIHTPTLALKSTHGLWPTIKLEAMINSNRASTIIAFNDGMTKGLDPTYDAGLLKDGSDLNLYSRLVEDNGVPFAIQALPSNEFESMIIPIGIGSKTGGEVIFSSELINLPSDVQVILEDKLVHTFTNLSQNVYSTTIEANSTISDRFRIHTSYLTTGLNKESFDGKVSAYAIHNDEIKVKGNVSNQAFATLYDVQGRMILSKRLEQGSLNTILTPNIRTGLYVLFVNDNGKVQGFKIPVTE